ncbi:MAG: nuclear transport factor 2 family protein [Pseudomonadota bacterium]
MSDDQARAAAAAGLARWHDMVAAWDFAQLPPLLHPDAVFRSPMAHTPYHGALALAVALKTVSEVFQDFRYHRGFVSEDGMSACLEFSARVGEKELKGVDLLRFDAEGRLVEMEVMVRPMSGLAALGEEMGRRLGGALGAARRGPTA